MHADHSIPPIDVAESEQYPLVTHVGADRRNPKSIHAASSGKSKTVVAEPRSIANDPEAVARLALEKARAGARVLVIRNLVDDCLATQRELENLTDEHPDALFDVDGTCAPHHSRFAPEDRRRLDDAIEASFGKNSPGRGLVAVATQTVEQSLDIDADLMITDLCPMDVLLQRIGRLHRHTRDRPDGFDSAKCVVLTPEERNLSPAISRDGQAFNGPHGLGTVYEDLRAVEATWQVLEDDTLDTWEIPRDNRLLVERATHPNQLEAIVEAGDGLWQTHEEWVLGSRQANRQAAGYVEVDREAPFGDELFPNDLENVKTRLGQDDYRVQLPEPVPGAFGLSVSELSVSAWQVDGAPEEDEVSQVEEFAEGFQFTFSGHSFEYTRFGLSVSSE